MNIDIDLEKIEKKGFLDVGIDPSLDLFEEINKLKKEKNKTKEENIKGKKKEKQKQKEKEKEKEKEKKDVLSVVS